jgi:putative peptidoglycan lipid II flippase
VRVTAGDANSEMRRDSSLVAAGIGVSRLSGLARDAALAFFLGANVGADAFRAALRIPNFLQNLLGEGVLSASFIPTYSRLLEDGREQEAGRVAGAVLGLLSLLTGLSVLLGVVFARPLTMLITPGFTGERLELTVTLVRIMFPGIGLLVISAWCLGVLNSHRRFFLSYVAPVLWNVGIMAALFGLGATALVEPAAAAAWGVVLGGALQVLIQLPTVRQVLAGTLRPSLDTRSPGVRRVLRAFGPIVLGRGVVQIAALLDLVVASLLAVGAVAVLGYAQTLYLLPIALFGMSVAAAELPTLSRMGPDARAELEHRLDDGLARSAFFVVGTSVGFLLLGGPIVGLLFGRGEFDAATTMQVGTVLAAYSLALVPATASRLLQSLLFATDDARTPAVVAVIRVGVALAIGIPLMFSFDQLVVDLSEPAGFRLVEGGALLSLSPVDAALREASTNQLRLGALGLAIGSVVGSWLEYGLLRRAVRRLGLAPRLGGGTIGRLLVAGLIAGVVIVVAGQDRFALGTIGQVLVPGVIAGLAYVAVCWLTRVPEARALGDLTRRRS